MAQATKTAVAQAKDIEIRSGSVQLSGDLSITVDAQGLVVFAHGSGSSRHSPRNQFVARTIREAGVGTLLFDLLTKEEEAVDVHTAHLRFDIGLLAERLIDATDGRTSLATLYPKLKLRHYLLLVGSTIR